MEPQPPFTPAPAADPAPALTAADVRKVARLARLALTDEEAEAERERLAAVLAYAERLRGLDLAGVEPMTHVGDLETVLRDDEPEAEGTGSRLTSDDLMQMAPETMPPFVRVPKVLGDGSA
mgnify:CR=1 FL=1